MSSAEARTYDPCVLDYLSRFDARLLQTSEGRRVLTRLHPKLFALVYLLHHLVDEQNHVSFGGVHDDWFGQMESWIKPVGEPREWRRAFVAPRSCGKSTMWFLVAPLWAGAHGFARFVAAFADSATQAETHLATFKSELSTNRLLRHDFPDLCNAAKRASGITEFDNRALFKSVSGFVFAARGVDASSLGLKVGDQRPDVIICDDLEPAESNYSAYQADKRLSTLVNAILPLSERARVAIVGTVTMPGSIVHQLVRTVTSTEPTPAWIGDERFVCHYYPAIAIDDDGQERSIWPAKWPLDWLRSIRHTRSYKLNYANDPVGSDGAYWTDADFTYGDVEAITRWLVSVDPTVSTKTSSDFTGIAVVGFSPSAGQVLVEHVEAVKLTGAALRVHLLKVCARYPQVRAVLVETNQGGETWADTLHDLPPGVTLLTVHQTVKKEVRAAATLTHYQRRRVKHARRLHAAEEQMVTFPKAPNDDMVDAVGAGVSYFLDPAPPPKRVAIRSQSYA